MNDVDTAFLQVRAIADAGAFQNLRRGDAAGGEDDFAPRMRFPFDPVMPVAYANRAAVLNDDPFGERLSRDLKVRPSLGRIQISPRRAQASPIAECILKEPCTFLCGAVIVGIAG